MKIEILTKRNQAVEQTLAALNEGKKEIELDEKIIFENLIIAADKNQEDEVGDYLKNFVTANKIIQDMQDNSYYFSIGEYCYYEYNEDKNRYEIEGYYGGIVINLTSLKKDFARNKDYQTVEEFIKKEISKKINNYQLYIKKLNDLVYQLNTLERKKWTEE